MRRAIPLFRYRKYQRSRTEERLDRVVKLADQLGLPRAALSTLIEALFYDLGDKNVVIPKQPEKRERELCDLVGKARRPVVVIVDKAQDLHPKTLTGLKRLMEVVAGGGGLLSMLPAGHPKLRIDLRRPEMEQVGYRTSVFEDDGVSGHQRDYMAWLLAACAEDGVKHELYTASLADLRDHPFCNDSCLMLVHDLTLAHDRGRVPCDRSCNSKAVVTQSGPMPAVPTAVGAP